MLTTGFGYPISTQSCLQQSAPQQAAASRFFWRRTSGSGPRGWNCPVRPAGDRSGADRLVPSWYLESSPTSGFSGWRHLRRYEFRCPKNSNIFGLQNWLVEISFPQMARIKFLGVLILWHMGMSQSQKQSKAWYPSVPLSLGITT